MHHPISLRLVVWAALAALLWLPAAPATGSGPASMLTQHNDNNRTGANLNETSLTTSNVNVSQFGKLFARAVDGHLYAQPLYGPGLVISGTTHNVVFVATMHDTVYAFDADDPAAAAPLWQVSLGTSAPITYTLPNTTTVGHDFGPPNYQDIAVEVGIVSTPVIDPNTHTLYVVALTKEPNPPTCPCQYAHRLHALDLATGAEKFGGPVVISGTVSGQGWDNVNGSLIFSSTQQLQRAGLLLNNGIVYIAFASYSDWTPYHGWLMGYNATTLQQVSIFNASPNSELGGIWQSGQGPSADSAGHVYLLTGNALYSPTVGDYGDSFLKLDPSGVVTSLLPVIDSFTPYDQANLDMNDLDLGSAGALLIPSTNLILGGGKSGKLYLLNGLDMGDYQQGPGGTDRVLQSFQATNIINNTGHIHGTPVFWNSPSGPRFYLWGEGEALKEFSLTINSPVSATIQTTPVATGTTTLAAGAMPGGFLSVSANGSTPGTGIVWASHQLQDANHNVVPGMLRAYDAFNVGVELWDSGQNAARDAVGNFAKFNPPMVANGKVYLGTFSGQLLVYGLLGSPSILTQPQSQTILSGQSVTLTVAASGQSPLHYQWYQGLSGDTSTPITGATAMTYATVPAVTTNYWVGITNTVGAVSSTTAVVTVNPGPVITTQPVSQTINPGRSVNLWVTALGLSPLSYRWYQGLSGDTSRPISGSVGANFSFTTPALTTTTDYWVNVSNPAGSISSTTGVITAVPSLPKPWVDADLGFVGFPGSATQASGVFSMTASGSDIWGTADSFNFAYQPLYGDGWIAARVDSLGATDPWAKAGVMIRQSLDPGAANAMIAVTPGNGVNVQLRPTTTGSSTSTPGDFATAPYWVKLVRSGSIFGGYQSSDGTTWTLVISGTIPMTPTVYVGLAVSAHNNALITSASFDHVVTQGTSVQPTILTQPQGQTTVSGHSVTVTVVATGTLPLAYQWYQGLSGDTTTPITGATAVTYTTMPLTTTTGFWVSVTNSVSTTNSATALITVNHSPIIMTQPLSQTIISGQRVTMTVVATSMLPLSFQWYQGASGDISRPVGMDAASFVTPPLVATTQYWVRVSNAAGSTDSDTASVTVANRVYLPEVIR